MEVGGTSAGFWNPAREVQCHGSDGVFGAHTISMQLQIQSPMLFAPIQELSDRLEAPVGEVASDVPGGIHPYRVKKTV
jgi:hypothetical protein